MLLADIAGKGGLHEGHRLWPHIESWAAELGLTGPDAIARASQPPRHLVPGQERGGGQPDRGACRLDSQPDTTSRSPGSAGRAGRWPEDAIGARGHCGGRGVLPLGAGLPRRSVPRRNRNRRPGCDPEAMVAGSSACPAGVRARPAAARRGAGNPSMAGTR